MIVIFFPVIACSTNKSNGAGELDLEEMISKMAEIRAILDTATVGNTDGTYPQAAYDELEAAYDELVLGVSKAKAGMLYLQYEVDTYVLNAEKAIEAFLISLQEILDPGTPAELCVFGTDSKGYIDFGESPEFGAGQQWTVESWIKYDAGFLEAAMGDFISTFNATADNFHEGWTINFMGTGLRTTIGMGPAPGRVFEWSGNYPTNFGEWNHIAAVWDASAGSTGQLRMYLNGNLFWERDNDIISGGVVQEYVPPTLDFRMYAFQRPTNKEACMTGYIKKFRKWNAVKSQSEIQALMNGDVDGTESGLVCAWDFTEMPDDESAIPDKTGKHSASIEGSHKWFEIK